MATITLAVVAKECVPGRVKTRLAAAVGDEAAALLARASLDDTLDTVRRLEVGRRVLFFDGEPPVRSRDDGFDVIAQPKGSLDMRLGALFDALTGPTLLIGMDTPHVTVHHLEGPLSRWSIDIDAWIGRATDGGFWALALRSPDGALVRGVPMSLADTGERQLGRLENGGLVVAHMPVLSDVDEIDDIARVVEAAPDSHFAQVWSDIRRSKAAG